MQGDASQLGLSVQLSGGGRSRRSNAGQRTTGAATVGVLESEYGRHGEAVKRRRMQEEEEEEEASERARVVEVQREAKRQRAMERQAERRAQTYQ